MNEKLTKVDKVDYQTVESQSVGNEPAPTQSYPFGQQEVVDRINGLVEPTLSLAEGSHLVWQKEDTGFVARSIDIFYDKQEKIAQIIVDKPTYSMKQYTGYVYTVLGKYTDNGIGYMDAFRIEQGFFAGWFAIAGFWAGSDDGFIQLFSPEGWKRSGLHP